MYFSKEAILKSFYDLGHITDGTGKKATEVTSALRYIVATSALIKRYRLEEGLTLSPKFSKLRNEFIEEVGKVVSIKDNLYTNNFINEILTNSDFAVRNNFLTTRLLKNGHYPGRPAPLLSIVDEVVTIHQDAQNNLLNHFHKFGNNILSFVIWLLREQELDLNDDLTHNANQLNAKLSELYEEKLFSSLLVDEKMLNLFLIKHSISIESLYQADKYNFSDFVELKKGEEPQDALINGENRIFYGAPGTGKSFRINEIIERVPEGFKERVTFHPEYDHSSFVGGYKPITEGEEIKYKFVPQVFTDMYVKAWKDLTNAYYLVIEEINRGNCAEIFGILFQILDRKGKYAITPSNELKGYLEEALGKDAKGISGGKMTLPPNLFIYATMNTSDQSLFPMDSAFKRRWSWEYIPICYEEVTEDGRANESFNYIISFTNGSYFNWIAFIKAVNAIIKSNSNLGMDKCLGNFFVSAEDNNISVSEFINKVLFYLWIDVFKDEDDSIFYDNLTYEDFFPIATNGEKWVVYLLNTLEVQIYPKASHTIVSE